MLLERYRAKMCIFCDLKVLNVKIPSLTIIYCDDRTKNNYFPEKCKDCGSANGLSWGWDQSAWALPNKLFRKGCRHTFGH